MKKYGIIILAAGESKRLGSPKQLVAYKDKTLLQHVMDEAAKVDETAVVVVFGAFKDNLLDAHTTEHIIAGINEDWATGMASSIQTGLRRLEQNYTDLEGVIIAVCDQPFLSSAVFEELIAQHKKSFKGIVASAYADTLGTPVFLDKKYFEELMMLTGDDGAKRILASHEDDVAQIDFEKGKIDIDTPKDLEAMKES